VDGGTRSVLSSEGTAPALATWFMKLSHKVPDEDQMRTTMIARRRYGLVSGLFTVLGLTAVMSACDRSPAPPREHDVVIGGLFSLSGPWSTLGQNASVAMELAVDDMNQYLAGNAAGVRFVAHVEDTRLEPDRALELAESLRARGAQILIGPQSSAEVERLRQFVDANSLLLVSPSSTAGSLAIAGDNVFRFTPTDSLEAVALTAMMLEDGIGVVVPVWRGDAGNAGLEQALRRQFAEQGGSVLQGVEYAAATQDFDATVEALRAQLEPAVGQHGAGSVGVYLAGFDEVVSIFERAVHDDLLGSVAWYGSNGVVLSDALLASPATTEFSARTGFPNPVLGLEAGARDIWLPLVERIQQRTGLEPDAFALAVYDAVWVAARAYVASGAPLDLERLKNAFTIAAASHYGATGWTVLDEAGDRRYGDFDFWGIRTDDGVPRWDRMARYETRTGTLVRSAGATR
jgi:branched-chain amino acid transport system substrate-binding protein